MASGRVDLETGRDADLVGEFTQGDESAFDALFHRYKDGVYSLVYRTVGASDADDVVQDVFIQVYRSLGRFRGESSLKTWVFRITLNVCRDWIRRKARRPVVPLEEIPEIPDIPVDLAAKWTQDELERAVQALPETERAAIELHYIQGMSYSELSEVLDCPDGTIKARIHSAITKLRRKLVVEEVDSL